MNAVLRAWARALGGTVTGRSVTCPGPGHSARDRSLSAAISAPDGFMVYSHAGDDWQACRDYVRAKLGLPPFNGSEPQRTDCSISTQRDRAGKQREDNPQDNASKAAWLWSRRKPITEDCPAAVYLRRIRGYGGPIPSTLGYLPASGKHPPAMIAACGFCEEPEPGVIDPPAIVPGVHLTRLTPDGRKAPIV